MILFTGGYILTGGPTIGASWLHANAVAPRYMNDAFIYARLILVGILARSLRAGSHTR